MTKDLNNKTQTSRATQATQATQVTQVNQVTQSTQVTQATQSTQYIKGVALYSIAYMFVRKTNKVIEFKLNSNAGRASFKALCTKQNLTENSIWDGAAVKIANPNAGQLKKDGSSEPEQIVVKCWASSDLLGLDKLEDGPLDVLLVEKDTKHLKQDGTCYKRYYIVKVE